MSYLMKEYTREELEGLPIPQLRYMIGLYDHCYFTLGNAIVSDQYYDTVESVFIERLSSPEDTVKSDFIMEGKADTTPHKYYMGSTERTYAPEKFKKWLKKCKDVTSFCISAKVDGVAISTNWHKGRLQIALTRGTEKEGENLTDRLLAAPNIPDFIRGSDDGKVIKISGELRGEIYVRQDDFGRFNDELRKMDKPLYKTPRHMTVGLLNSGENLHYLRLAIYGTPDEKIQHNFMTHYNLIGALEQTNLAAVMTFCVDPDEVEDLTLETVEEFVDEYQVIPVDGVVVCVNEYEERKKYPGNIRKPGWQIAYKLPSAISLGKIQDIRYDINTMGRYIPKALIGEVKVGNLVARELTLYNTAFQSEGNYYPGKDIKVELTGDTVMTIKPDPNAPDVAVVVPTECPYCGSESIKDGDYLACSKPKDCKGVLAVKLERFFSRKGVNLTNIGKKTLTAMTDAGVLKPSDFFKLSEEEILKYPNGKNIWISRNNIFDTPTKKLLYAIGIDGMGRGTIDRIETFDVSSIPQEYRDEINELAKLGFVNLKPLVGV